MPIAEPTPFEATARCACGACSLHLSAPPRRVYGCACTECQRATGTAFAWRAIFADQALQTIAGAMRSWRRTGDSGRWLDQHFCPACGTLLYMTAEAMPGAISVSAGSLVGHELPPPAAIHNLHRAPAWLELDAFAPSG